MHNYPILNIIIQFTIFRNGDPFEVHESDDIDKEPNEDQGLCPHGQHYYVLEHLHAPEHNRIRHSESARIVPALKFGVQMRDLKLPLTLTIERYDENGEKLDDSWVLEEGNDLGYILAY